MLRDDLLRSKKDDLAQVISSRKRKLSELYYATAGATDGLEHEHEHEIDHHHAYKQREADFLDANDITKGRMFSEDTLPELPEITFPPSPSPPPAKRHEAEPGPERGPDTTKLQQEAIEEAEVETEAARPQEEPPAPPATTAIPRAPSLATAQPQTAIATSTAPTTRPSLAPLQLVPSATAGLASSPISEPTPKTLDQGLQSPSSSVTSATTHAPTAASPRKSSGVAVEGLQTEGKPPPSLTLKEEREKAEQKELSQVEPHKVQEPPTPAKDSQKEEDEAAERQLQEQAAAEAAAETAAPTPQKPQAPAPPTITTAATPTPTPAPAPAPLPQPERMTTRVSSGAIRHKSVSEILGEKPKPSPTPEAVKEAKEAKERATLSSRLRLKERRERENERSKLSTVVFPKQSPLKQKGGRRRQGAQQRRQPNRGKGVTGGELTLRQGPRPPAHPSEENDYLFTLFQAKAHLPPRSLHLNTLLASAHKILSTADHLVDYNEQMSCRTLKRLYQLQSGNRWPLRQIERSQEPSQGGLHWDVVLNHARWMATDFREERKWKIVAAKACAEWCREYVLADAEEKAELRVNAYIPPLPTPAEQQRQGTEELPDAHTTPDLVSHGDASSSIAADDFFDEPGRMGDTVVPAAIFSLGSDEFTINLDRTAARDSILDELPLFAPVHMGEHDKKPLFHVPPEKEWQPPILPVSKFALGKLEFPPPGPPKKRSRYDYYDSDDEAEEDDNEPEIDSSAIPPELDDVALFKPEYKAFRDRIYPGAAFRSPMEFPIPRQEFFDERLSSVWTPQEDAELCTLAKEYSYNWSLIAACLTHRSSQRWASPCCSSLTPSIYVAAADRRTPWECFERWTCLEPLPADVMRHPAYLKYRGMIEQSQQKLNATNKAAAQQQRQQAASGQAVVPTRPVPRVNTPIAEPVRHTTRHVATLDAIRKLQKKREVLLQKQQHTTQVANQRRFNESNMPRIPPKTPQEWAAAKQERDQKMQEQMRQAAIAQQRAVLAHRLHMQQQQQQYAQHAAAAAGVYQQHGPASAHPQPGAGPLPTGHVPPPPPQAFGPTSIPTAAAAQHLAANGMPMRHPSNGMSGPSAAAAAAAAAGMPGVNGGMHVPGMPPGHIAPTPAAPHHGANPQAPPPHLAMHPAAANGNAAAAVMAVRQQGGHLPPGAAAALHAAMGNGGAGGSAPQLPGAMMMKMTPTAAAMDHAPLGMGNVPAPAASGRASISSQNSGVDNARILREASRLQEQQRLVQSRQQQQQQQHGGPHHAGHHQLAGQQPLLSQARGSPGLAVPATAGPGPRASPMMGAAFPQAAATGAGSPPFTHNSHVTSAPTAASPRQNAGSPMAMASVPMTSAPSQGGHPHPHPQQQQQQPNHQQHAQPQQHPLTQPLPSLMAIQASIQRANPKLTPEQAGKYAAEKLHQFQQQRMSQMAMSAAAGTIGAMNPAQFGHANAHGHGNAHGQVQGHGHAHPQAMQAAQQVAQQQQQHANQHPHGHPSNPAQQQQQHHTQPPNAAAARNHVNPYAGHGSPMAASASMATPGMQRLPSQGLQAQNQGQGQRSPGTLSAGNNAAQQAQGYSPLVRTATTHSQGHSQSPCPTNYPQQQPSSSNAVNAQQNMRGRPPSAASNGNGHAPGGQGISTPNIPSSVPAISSPSANVAHLQQQQQMRRSASNHAAMTPVSNGGKPQPPTPSGRQSQPAMGNASNGGNSAGTPAPP